MDLENQKRIKAFADTLGKDDIIVILGSGEAEAAGLAAETVINGDPTFAGALAGVQLGLKVYHIMEDEIKEAIDPAVYEAQIAMMEMVLEVEAITAEMKKIRAEYGV
jgi:betaine reductase